MSDDLEWVKYYGQQAAGCVRHARLMRPQKTISNFEVYAGPDSSVVEKGHPLGHSLNSFGTGFCDVLCNVTLPSKPVQVGANLYFVIHRDR